MARARILLTVDDVDGPRIPGDPVTGRVDVLVDGKEEVEGVFVRLGWRTGKEANGAAGWGPERELPGSRRTWNPGEAAVLPFSLAVPEGPPTFRGKRLSVEWVVKARVGVPWALDPTETVPVAVAAPPASQDGLARTTTRGTFEFGCALSCLLVFLLCAAAILLSRRSPGVVPWIVGGVAGLVAFFMVPVSIGYRRAGPVVLEAGPVAAAPGGELAVRLVAVPRKGFDLKRMKAVLVATESTEHGSGKSKSTRKAVLAQAETLLDGPDRVEAGRETTWAGILRIPGDAPPSLVAGPHKVAWELKVEMTLPAFPDPSWEVEVKVGG